MTRTTNGARALLSTAVVAALFLAVAGNLHAGDENEGKKDTSKVAKRGQDHLAYKKTYADALLESRIRNVPVFVSRHKDF